MHLQVGKGLIAPYGCSIPFTLNRRSLTRAKQTTFENMMCNLPFATMISTLFNYHTFIYKDFSDVSKYVLKDNCCSFVVCGNGIQ